MKKNIKVTLAVGLTAAIGAATALSQTNIITVDEFGLGTYNGAPLPSGVAVDLYSGMATLSYLLPFPGVRGDVVLSEPSSGLVSDVLRFDGNFNLYFFSDVSPGDPADSPADVGLPSTYLPPVLFFVETGPEAGPNGLFGYIPGFNDPGADSSGVLYNFISDVPEPNSLTLLACGLGLCGLLLRWKRQARG